MVSCQFISFPIWALKSHVIQMYSPLALSSKISSSSSFSYLLHPV
jgi:hypothetical protein